MDALSAISTRRNLQTSPADASQVRNNAGGYTFQVTPETRLNRFLVLGVGEGTYYVNANDFAQENAQVVFDFAANRTAELVAAIVDVSRSGRAPKNNPALFALAAAASMGDVEGRRAALDALPLVARTGTHLFQFAEYVQKHRGWGRGLRRGVARWYSDKTLDDLAYQMAKYRQRDGWTHRDLLRLSHDAGETLEEPRRRLYNWASGRETNLEGLGVVEGFHRAQTAPLQRIPDLVREYRLSWEMLPDAALNHPGVWEALLDNGMPQTALMRQLPRLTRLGLLSPLGNRAGAVAAQLTDTELLRKGRVHPINVLIAHRTYAQGRSLRGQGTWEPSAPIIDALDAAFYNAFAAVEPTGLSWLLALDVSGSMGVQLSGLPLSAREASVAMALVMSKVEEKTQIVGFTSGRYGRMTGDGALTPLSISHRQRLADAVREVSSLPFGGTDCALPMLYATERKLHVDVFVVATDNETWAGHIHPHQALTEYRQKVNPHARLAVLGMTATNFTIADPSDSGELDIAGMDAGVPTLLNDFARGRV